MHSAALAPAPKATGKKNAFCGWRGVRVAARGGHGITSRKYRYHWPTDLPSTARAVPDGTYPRVCQKCYDSADFKRAAAAALAEGDEGRQ